LSVKKFIQFSCHDTIDDDDDDDGSALVLDGTFGSSMFSNYMKNNSQLQEEYRFK